MKKKNNRGFLLSESLIVSTFVLTVIVLIFVQFKGIIVNNKRQYTYNSVENIYSLSSFGNFLSANNIVYETDGMIFSGGSSGSCSISDKADQCTNLARSMGVDYILYVDSDMDYIRNSLVENITNVDENQDLVDFIERINTDKVEGKKRLIARFTNGNFATVVIDSEIESGEQDDSGEDTSSECSKEVKNGWAFRFIPINSRFSNSKTSWNNGDNISAFTPGLDYYYSDACLKQANPTLVFYVKNKIENDIVTESYVCYNTLGYTPFSGISVKENCMQGGVASAYSKNKEVIGNFRDYWLDLANKNKLLFPHINIANAVENSCTFGDDYSQCFNMTYNGVKATSSGTIDVRFTLRVLLITYSYHCTVKDDGESYCAYGF